MDPEILDKYKAGLTIEEIKKGVSLANSVGIKNTGMFMMGFPEETAESIAGWTKGIGGLGLDSIRLSIVTPLPGTKFRSDLLRGGIKVEGYSGRYDTGHLVYDHPTLEKMRVEELRCSIVSQFLASK